MIDLKLTEKSKKKRTYNLGYKKDNRFKWRTYRLVFYKSTNKGWVFSASGSWSNLNRECILAIESILRGLCS